MKKKLILPALAGLAAVGGAQAVAADEAVNIQAPENTAAEVATQAETQAQTPVTQAQVAQASDKAAETQAVVDNLESTKAEQETVVANNQEVVAQAEETVTQAQNQVNAATPEAKAEANQAIADAATKVAETTATEKAATATVADAQKNLDSATLAEKSAETKVADAENTVADAETKVADAVKNLEGTDIPALEAEKTAATADKTAAEQAVKTAETKLAEAKTADGSKAEALTKATEKVAEKAADVKTAESAVSTASATKAEKDKAVLDATVTLNNAKEALSAIDADEAARVEYNSQVTVTDEYVKALTSQTSTDGDRYLINQIEPAVKNGNLKNQRYKMPKVDTSEVIGGGNINNATDAQKKELNQYALNLLQGIWDRVAQVNLGLDEHYVRATTRQSIWDMAQEIAESGKTSTKTLETYGHDEPAIQKAAGRIGLADGGNFYESLLTVGDNSLRYTMEEMKAEIYNAFVVFLYDDLQSNYGHTKHVMQPAFRRNNTAKKVEYDVAFSIQRTAGADGTGEDAVLEIHMIMPLIAFETAENGTESISGSTILLQKPSLYNRTLLQTAEKATDNGLAEQIAKAQAAVTAAESALSTAKAEQSTAASTLANAQSGLDAAKLAQAVAENELANLKNNSGLQTPAAEEALAKAKENLATQTERLAKATDALTKASASTAEKTAALAEARAELDSARIALTSARKALTERALEVKAAETALADAKTALESATAAKANAQAELEKAQAKLADLENAPEKLEAAKLALLEAERNLKMSEDALTNIKIKLAAAKRDNDEAQATKRNLLEAYTAYVRAQEAERKTRQAIEEAKDGSVKVTVVDVKPDPEKTDAGTIVYVKQVDGSIKAISYQINTETGHVEEVAAQESDLPGVITDDAGREYVRTENGVYVDKVEYEKSLARRANRQTPVRPLTSASQTRPAGTKKETSLAKAGEVKVLPNTGEAHSALALLGLTGLASLAILGKARKED